MCVILSGENQPDTTKLMNIPVIIDKNKYNFFIYVNNFELYTGKKMSSVFVDDNIGSIGNYATFQSNDEFYKNNRDFDSANSIMVVPFPVEKGTTFGQIGLVDISTKSMKNLRDSIESLKPVSRSASTLLGMKSYSTNSTEPIEVHTVGNYNISVATTLHDLLNRIDWNKFKKPDDFEQRMKGLKNENLYPSQYNYFYVVASAIENIKNDGFGIVYPQLKDCFYIPTAHEDNSLHHKYDVEIFSFDYNKNSSIYNSKYIKQSLSSLQNQNVKMLNGTYKKMDYDESISSFNYKEENGLMKNHNIWLNK